MQIKCKNHISCPIRKLRRRINSRQDTYIIKMNAHENIVCFSTTYKSYYEFCYRMSSVGDGMTHGPNKRDRRRTRQFQLRLIVLTFPSQMNYPSLDNGSLLRITRHTHITSRKAFLKIGFRCQIVSAGSSLPWALARTVVGVLTGRSQKAIGEAPPTTVCCLHREHGSLKSCGELRS